MYKLLFDVSTGKNANVVIKVDENLTIPFDERNTDYQRYLRWLAEGNTPEPADE